MIETSLLTEGWLLATCSLPASRRDILRLSQEAESKNLNYHFLLAAPLTRSGLAYLVHSYADNRPE